MALDTIQVLLARRPFEPFQIVTSSGDRYEVRHSELVLRVKNGLYVGQGGAGLSLLKRRSYHFCATHQSKLA